MISKRAFRVGETRFNPVGPRLLGMRGAIATEHYLSAQAGAEILKAGGNAVDAAVAAALVEGVVNPHMHTLGGECPMLISMEGRAPVAINGNTMAPAAATPTETLELAATETATDTASESMIRASLNWIVSESMTLTR